MIPGLKKRTVNFYDLMMYVAIVRKHIRLMVLTFTLCALAVLNFYVYARSVYRVTSLVRMEQVARPSGVDADSIDRGTFAEVALGQLTAPDIMVRTAARLGIKMSAQDIAGRLIKKITMQRNGSGDLEVSVWGYNRAVAMQWCEAMVAEFLAFREEQRSKQHDLIIRTYKREMEELGQKLDQASESQFQYEQEKGTTLNQIKLSELSTLPNDLALTKRRLAEMERVHNELDNPALDTVEKLSIISSYRAQSNLALGQIVQNRSRASNGDEAEGAAPPAENNSSVIVVPSLMQGSDKWQQIESEMRSIEAEKTKLLETFRPGNYRITALQKKIDGLMGQLEAQYQTQYAHFDLEYQSLKRKATDLEARLPEYNETNKRYTKLQQDFSLYKSGDLSWQSMYSGMAKKLSSIDFAQDKERINLFYDGILLAKPFPDSPNRFRLFLMAIGLGLAAAIALPFGIEYLDHTIADFNQAETLFQIRGLGIIPALESAEVEKMALMDSSTSNSNNLMENFRVIRTNILSMGTLTKAPHAIMITSAVPKEGKTVISTNLALSFAQMGAKTILVDVDLRRGRLHRVFGLRKAPGMTQVLMGKCTLEEACRPTGRENLDILTAGEHLNTATELLSSTRFSEVVDQLRTKYDRIIFDTPPVLGLSETSVIQTLIDGIVFVAWAGKTPIKSMQLAVELLQNNGGNFYGFVLNRIDLTDSANYYQYYYYSNDYYRNYHALENA
jgi:capsular exopolysaccharide synthesis family protein